MRRFLAASLLVALPTAGLWASPAPLTRPGVVFATSAQGPWSPTRTADSEWTKCVDPQGSVVNLAPGVNARLAEGAQIHTHGNTLSGLQGRAYVQVASAPGPVVLDAGTVQVQASQGEFLVESRGQGLADLQVVSGDVTVGPGSQPEPKLFAGKDMRARGIKRDKVSNRKENTKGLGRVKSKKPVAKTEPPPAPPETPPPPAPPTQAFVGPPAPEVPVGEFLPAVVAGGAGLLGTVGTVTGIVGGITGVVVATTSGGTTDTPVQVIAPASL